MWSISRPAGRSQRGAGAAAMFVRVADAITKDIRRGALHAGDRLPSTRELARRFELNRNTIVAAYDELVAQGWIVTRGPGGTFVSDEVPDRAVRRAPAVARGMASRPAFDMRSIPPKPSVRGPGNTRYHLSLGVPDVRLLP